MYEEYYGLSEPPFSLTPDPKYFYRSEAHSRAFELFNYGIQRREGFMVLYGDIGMGKTTLCRTVLDGIDSTTHTALLLNPFLSEMDLLKAMLRDFAVPLDSAPPNATKQDLIDLLNEFLIFTVADGGRAVLLIDEAQNLPLATLEQVRILSNLETSKQKLLQIILVGQLNLLDVLSRQELRQLFQRISIKCELAALTRDELGDYLRHRLTMAGGAANRVSFAAAGVDELFKYSGGVPRLINLIADRSLLAGMAMNINKIDRAAVREAVKTLQLSRPSRNAWASGLARPGWLRRAAVTVGLSALLVLVALALMQVMHGWSGLR